MSSKTAVKQERYKGFYSQNTLIPFLFDCCLGVSIRRSLPGASACQTKPEQLVGHQSQPGLHIETNVQIGVDGSVVKAAR